MDMIPDRKEFKRADVERITSLSGKVLDYWEEEFAVFFPKNKNNEKIYLHKDVQIILKLKQYLTVERLNKAEIKEKLSGEKNHIVKKIKEISEIQKKKEETKLKSTKKEIVEIKDNVESTPILEQKFKIKQNNNKNNKLNLLKQDLQEILTILKNNDRNST